MVEDTSYDYKGERFNEFSYGTGIIVYSFLYTLFCLVLVELPYGISNNRTLIIGNIIQLKKLLIELKEHNNTYKEVESKLKETINTIIDEINKYEELKEKFNQVYEENKYLLDNPEELKEKFRVATLTDDYIDDTKRFIKEYKSK